MKQWRKQLLATVAVAAMGSSLGFVAAAWAATVPVEHIKMIKVSAKRFIFEPDHLTLKKGEMVEIVLSTQDVLMGFNVPGLSARATIVPGEVARLRITPQKTGDFTFLCDIFCGSGHEDMNGVISVVD